MTQSRISFTLFVLLGLFTNVLLASEPFYELSIPDDISHIRIKDNKYDNFATMRFATKVSPAKILAFYQSQLKKPLTITKFKDTTIISFTLNDVKKMISITNYIGVADVVLQSDK